MSAKNISLGGSGGGDAYNPWSPLIEGLGADATLATGSEEKMINVLFPTIMDLPPPTSGESLKKWNDDIKRDKGLIQAKMNWQCLQRTLSQTHLSLEATLSQLECFKKTPINAAAMEKILALACSSTLQTSFTSATHADTDIAAAHSPVIDTNRSLVITASAINQAVKIYQKVVEGSLKLDTRLKNIVTDNDFEKRILESCVIPASQLNVQFKDIGSLDKVKKTMEELIMLPLRRPELFKRGQLIHSTRGILLCGA